MSTLLRWLAVALASVSPIAFGQGTGKVEVLWLGQACVKITTPGGKVIVIDPWLSTNPKTPAAYKDFDALGKIDLILVSHAHFDHFTDAPALAKKNNVKIWGPQGLHSSMNALGIVPAELTGRFGKGGTLAPWGAGGVKISPTHAEHDGELMWKNPATGKDEAHVGGEPMGFIIELENGFRIYHMGDTALFGDMKLIGDYYKPDLILIPIGGHFVMDPKAAAQATQWLKPKYAMPIHYGTYPILAGTPEEYMKALGDAPVKVFPINPGDKLTF